MEKIFTVYCHENKVNGKKYFGITSKIPKRRWSNGKGYNSNKYFTSSISKYGWNDGFCHIILFENLEKDKAEEIEVYLIRKYKTFDNRFGYNIKLGGNVKNCYTKETRKKISDSKIGRPLTQYQIDCLNNSRIKYKIVQLSMCGELIKIFDSGLQIQNEMNFETKVIRECCKKTNNRRKTAYNYIWMYYEDYVSWDRDMSYYKNSRGKQENKPISQFTLD